MPSPKRNQNKLAKLSSAKTLAKQLNTLFSDHTAQAGRPVLTPDVIVAFEQLVMDGRPLPWVCDLLGVWQPTVANWVQRGDAFMINGGKPKEDGIYYVFTSRVRRAAKIYLMDVQDKQSLMPAGEWQKFAWILERLEPKIFGRKDQNQQTNDTYQPDDRFV